MQVGSAEVHTCSQCGGPRTHGSECASCKRNYMREYQRRRRLQPGVRERDRALARSYRANHPEANLRTSAGVKQKRAWLATLKEGPCCDCRGSFPACCMDFDHRGPKTKGLGVMASQSSREAILMEIAKYDLVCACDHRIRTEKRHGVVGTKPHESRVKIRELKSNTPCLDCGKHFAPVAMDFDHVRGQKKATISQMTSAKWKRVPWAEILIELAKCDIVCANCHRTRTSLRASSP